MRRMKEEVTLTFSVLKWIIYATFAGLVVGTATFMFIKLLNLSILGAKKLPIPAYYLAPLGLFISTYLVKKFAPSAKGHGTEKVIEAIHKNNGKMNIMVVPVKLLATIITIAFGGSAGKEGPSAQIGATITSFFSDLFKISVEDRKKLVICGISAGFGAVFGTPIAGAIFAVEVLFVGSLLYEALLPAFIASIVASLTAKSLGMYQETFRIVHISEAPVNLFLKIIVVSIIFAIISFIFIELINKTEHFNEKLKTSPYIKSFVAGIAILLMGAFVSKNSVGLGADIIKEAIDGKDFNNFEAFFKMITTTITLTFGGSGGILTPVFYIGATAGSVIDKFFHNKDGLFAAIGLVAVLSGAANTPIAASIMAAELFGLEILPYSTLACIITFLLTGHRGVYPTQILAMKKSSSLSMDLGVELSSVKIDSHQEDTYDKYVKKVQDSYTLNTFIKRNNIIILKNRYMDGALQKMVSRACKLDKTLSHDIIYNAILDRENVISTNFESQIAFPHADLEDLDEFKIIVGISKEGIIWDENKEKVNIVFLILKPKDKQNQYLKILSSLVKFAKDKSNIEKTIRKSNVEDILEDILK